MRHRDGTVHAGLLCGLIVLAGCSGTDEPTAPVVKPGPESASPEQECPPSSEWDPDSGDSPPQDPPAGTCQPGPDQMTDALVIDSASVEPVGGDELLVELEVTNTTDLSRAFVLPTSADPRVDEEEGVPRFSFLRVNMILDAAVEDGEELGVAEVNIDNPGWPESIAVAAGETLSYSDTILLHQEFRAQQLQVCAEVKPEAHPDAPASQQETGHTSHILVRGFGLEQDPVPLTCSEIVEVG